MEKRTVNAITHKFLMEVSTQETTVSSNAAFTQTVFSFIGNGQKYQQLSASIRTGQDCVQLPLSLELKLWMEVLKLKFQLFSGSCEALIGRDN